jgi:DNA-binding FadR family transcriptional regulator
MATAVDLVGVHGTRNAALATPGLATPGLAAYSHAPADKLATRVAGRIEAEIVRRGWPTGQSLGSESELREHYGVSRAVLREAVRLVEHHQLARMQRGPGGGLLVVTPDAGPATRASVIYLEYLGTSVEDMLAARLLLEPLAVQLAAERITEDGITLLRRTLDAEAERGEPDMWSHDPLHVVLGELSGNPVLRLFIDVLTRLTNRYAHLVQGLPPGELAASLGRCQRWHASIVEAVIAGDAGRAQTRMSDYLDTIAAWLHEHGAGQAAGYRMAGGPPGPDGPGAPAQAGPAKAKLAEVVAARIHQDIVRQGWPVGEVLGSEARLLVQYGISRAVLREAVRLLEYHAVARMRRGPGGGLIVAQPESQASFEAMAQYLEYKQGTGEDLQMVREAIELGTVARVVARRDDPQVAGRLDAATRWAAEVPVADPGRAGQFHTELAQLAGNPVLVLFLGILSELFRRQTARQNVPVPPAEVARQVAQTHQRILDAILAGDGCLARHRMRRHMAALTPWWQ